MQKNQAKRINEKQFYTRCGRDGEKFYFNRWITKIYEYGNYEPYDEQAPNSRLRTEM